MREKRVHQFAEFFEKHFDWTADKKKPRMLSTLALNSYLICCCSARRQNSNVNKNSVDGDSSSKQRKNDLKWWTVVVCGNFVSKLNNSVSFYMKNYKLLLFWKYVLSKVWPWIIMVRYVLTCLLNGHIQYTLSPPRLKVFLILLGVVGQPFL